MAEEIKDILADTEKDTQDNEEVQKSETTNEQEVEDVNQNQNEDIGTDGNKDETQINADANQNNSAEQQVTEDKEKEAEQTQDGESEQVQEGGDAQTADNEKEDDKQVAEDTEKTDESQQQEESQQESNTRQEGDNQSADDNEVADNTKAADDTQAAEEERAADQQTSQETENEETQEVGTEQTEAQARPDENNINQNQNDESDKPQAEEEQGQAEDVEPGQIEDDAQEETQDQVPEQQDAEQLDEQRSEGRRSAPPTPQQTMQETTRPTTSSSRGSKRGPPTGTDEQMYPTQPPPTQAEMEGIPEPPHLPSRERSDTGFEGTMSNSALNIIWSFGLNRNVPVLNLTDGVRKVIMYPCAHVGVLYDFHNNRQHILQGHANPITCSCVSEDKRWLVTGDRGSDSMVIIWDTYTGTPIQTLFDPNPQGGVVAVSLTPDARYLATLSAADTQVLSIWDWTLDGETPVCTAELKPSYGVQNFIHFNPENIHFLMTNSESQIIFYHWEERLMQFYAPPLTDQDFNKPVGRYSQSIFQVGSSRALTGTSIGNLVVWDNNQPVAKVQTSEQSANKKALKIIRLQDRGINVLTTTDRYIVVGDVAGHVKFFDQTLKLIYWYQEFDLGPVTALSFAFVPEFSPIASEVTKYPQDATIAQKKFVIRDFVVGSSIAIFGNITADGSKVEIIHREHDASIHAMAAHPAMPYLAIGSYSGLLKIWNYEKKDVMVSRMFERGNLIRCCSYDCQGGLLAVGFTNGTVRVLDSITLQDETDQVFRYSRDAITHLTFSLDSQYLATADAEYAVTVFKKERISGMSKYTYLGRYRAHYKPIRDILFGVQLDSSAPRLVSLGEDRVMVEYDLENSEKDHLVLASSDRIEQSAVPLCMAWYPPITKEHFIVTANDQFKFKLYNTTTKMCRKTLLGPTYGSPVTRMSVVPTKDELKDKRYLAYTTEDKVGLSILPLTGNPHNSMALVAHPSGVASLAVSFDGRCLFTAGGADAAVHMWEVNVNALEAQAQLGGEDLIPFYGLLDGGREGDLFAELEDYFYYAQIRSQSVNTMASRQVSTKILLSEVPYVMRAMGFYPSEQEIEDMLNEVKFSQYVETGQYVDDIDLGDFIKLYVNHRPAFGLSPEKILWAFETLGIPTDQGAAVERGDLLELLQSKGEHMTEYELAEYLTTLMGFNPEGGSMELQEFDASTAGDVIEQNLPYTVTGEMFSKEILGFSPYDANTPQPS